MDIKIGQYLVSESIAVIYWDGDLNVYTAPRLRERVIKLVNSGHVHLVIDVGDTEMVDSTGLGVLVTALKRARAFDGNLHLVVTEERILKIFRITGMTKIFAIHDTLSEALNALAHPSYQVKDSEIASAEDFASHWFQGRIYTSEESAGEEVEKSLRALFESLGVEVVYEFPIQRSSWFREFLLRMKDSTVRPTRDEVLAMAERAIEQQILDKPQAQIDLAQSQAVAGLVMSLEKTPNAVIQVGSLLVVKVGETTLVRNLTQQELVYLQRNPKLFRDPEKALLELQRLMNPADTQSEPQQADAL